MFDVDKVRQMTAALEKFVGEHDNIYLIAEVADINFLPLIRRLQMNVRALLSDETNCTQTFGLPVLKTVEAAKIFNERTGIIVFVEKPLPIFRTELPFDVNGDRMNVPTFILSPDEIFAIYDRLILTETLQLYRADGFQLMTVRDMALHFSRGMKNFVGTTQTLKFQFMTEARLQFRYDFSDAAIVIQGPIVYENDYTATTLKLYRTIYPNAPIVVSTWQGEATDEFRRACRENSVALLENVPPDFAGPYNVNMQLESSLQGVKFVRENTDAKFVLKTRCDQRINKPDFLTWFRNLILTFPPIDDKLRGRILLAEALKWRSFRITDFLAFGYVEDIAKLYGIARHESEIFPVVYRKNHNRRFMQILSVTPGEKCNAVNFVPSVSTKTLRKYNRLYQRIHEVETHILKTFYEENIGAIDYDKFLETGWKFMRDYLVIVGVSEIRLDWPKYEENSNYSVDGWFSNEIDFARWLDLYRNFNSFGLD